MLMEITEEIKRTWRRRRNDYSAGGVAYRRAGGDLEIALIATRSGTRWQLPKGTCESGETAEQTALREVAEEVGVSVGTIEYFSSQPWPYPHQIMVGFLAAYAGGDVAIDANELDEARWFHIDALPVIPPPMSIARQLINAWAARHGRDTTANA